VLDDWATDLEVEAKQVEMFIYGTRGRLFDPARAFRALASAAEADDRAGYASPRVAFAGADLPPETTVSY
jgi:hypothetical protein